MLAAKTSTTVAVQITGQSDKSNTGAPLAPQFQRRNSQHCNIMVFGYANIHYISLYNGQLVSYL
ncbi:hypothetical protein CVS40_9330 [Lucilia cuprina]|nr:hypothetical protein CVS40_9330 [Lucilia cuprina]